MKKLLNRSMAIAFVSLFFVFSSAQKSAAQDVTVSYQEFYDNLSPYGQWVEDPQYGNVWVPNEGGDFRPYGSRGHWVMTDYGNTWVSEDPWGWACYHYGRWTYDSYYGWVWIPGYEWAPAWVSWRYGGGYSGWAPLGPGISVGVSYNCPESWWIFVQPQYMYQNDCYHHWRGPSYNNTYIRQTTIVNNYYVDNGTHVRYNYGPRADAIQRDTHRPVEVYRVSRMNRPGAPTVENNRVNIYRPAVNRNTQTTARPTNVMQAPRQISHRPEPATNVSAGRQPEFRQQMQRHAPQVQQPGNRPQPQVQQPGNRPQPQVQQPGNRPQPQVQQPGNRPQPQRMEQPQNRPQPQRMEQPQNRPQPQRMEQPQNRPQPQRMEQPQNRPQPQRIEQPQNRPQPQRMEQPQNRPQPQRMEQPQNRPQPQRMEQPQNRPQPQMQQPQNRPQPQMQQPQGRPQPQQHEAPRQEQHEGGRR